ncbi:MAG: NAD-dependent epimerase/dehydratase family protein [Herpetosiphon sp.]|nr:NAD-dependent epimerase/dehydratase family protein [Herpetosiphon sp.]
MNRVLVIGGCGFVGSMLVAQLLEQQRPVRVLDLSPFPDDRVESIVGDMCHDADVLAACRDVITVFLCAAYIDWGWGNIERVWAVNARGAQNVVRACLAGGVSRLIYTSTVDVVFDGTPISNGDESLPYPDHHLDEYGASKALGEQIVLLAHSSQLATCALRLGGVYGPNDGTRLPALIAAGRVMPIPRFGDGSARFTHIYVENAAHAHLLAEQHLTFESVLSGQAYFIVDEHPENFYRFLAPLLAEVGVNMATRGIPTRLIYGLALVSEAWYRLMRHPSKPALTRYTVLSTCVDFWFTSAKAQHDFGYQPLVGYAEGLRRTTAWLHTTYGQHEHHG